LDTTLHLQHIIVARRGEAVLTFFDSGLETVRALNSSAETHYSEVDSAAPFVVGRVFALKLVCTCSRD